MGRQFLNWVKPEVKKRGLKYMVWTLDGKQQLYKPITTVELAEGDKALFAKMCKELEGLRTESHYYRRKRGWENAGTDVVELFQAAIKMLFVDIRSFIGDTGGNEAWDILGGSVSRSWSDPKTAFANVQFNLRHKIEGKLFELDVTTSMVALSKRVKIAKTAYDFQNTAIVSTSKKRRGYGHNIEEPSPFVSDLPLGGQVKVVIDGAAKDTAQLTLSKDCNGNIPRFWDILCTVLDILNGEHYKYFRGVSDSCKGQFADMALKTLQELAGVSRSDITYDGEEMKMGTLTVKFLDIPDAFEENPEDRISTGVTEDEEEDDE